jgi:hypothetical protein
MICKNKLMIVLALTLILLAGCGAESSTVSPLATPEPAVSSPVPATGNETPQPSSVLPLHDVVTDPDKYVGQQVTVEGVLEAEGQMPRLHFFLVDGTDRLEVSPWAPVEAVQSPQGGGKVKTMAYYAGLRLRLTGVLEKGADGLLLRVSAAEELQ